MVWSFIAGIRAVAVKQDHGPHVAGHPDWMRGLAAGAHHLAGLAAYEPLFFTVADVRADVRVVSKKSSSHRPDIVAIQPVRKTGCCWVELLVLPCKALLPLQLSVVYFRWKPDVATLTAWLPDLLVIAIFILCWRYRLSWGRHALFALGSFMVALFPALGFVNAQYQVKFQVSDHLQYLPLIALIALVGGLAGHGSRS